MIFFRKCKDFQRLSFKIQGLFTTVRTLYLHPAFILLQSEVKLVSMPTRVPKILNLNLNFLCAS